MLVVAAYITDVETFQTNAALWMQRLPPSDFITAQSTDEPSVAAGYNSVLDAFAHEPSVEAIVLCRQEITVSDPELASKVRSVLQRSEVAVAGVVGGSDINTLAWWDGNASGNIDDGISSGTFDDESHDVDVLDNSFVIITPWAAQNLRFDATLGESFDGIVEDFCMQAKAAGKSVATLGIAASTADDRRYTSLESWRHAYEVFDKKWTASFSADGSGRLASLLELGGGLNALPSWLNIDTEHGQGDFRRGVQETPWPIPDNHVRMIWASHVMEHVDAGRDRIVTMNEAWRVLRPGGLFEMRMPCFPSWQAVADPTHVSYWVPQSFLYFTDEMMPSYEWSIKRWECHSVVVNDGWELRAVMRKSIDS